MKGFITLPLGLLMGTVASVAIGLMATQCSQGEKQLGKALEITAKHGEKAGDTKEKLGRCEATKNQKGLEKQLKHKREMRKLDIEKWKKANKELWGEVNECIKQYKKLKKSCKSCKS